MLHYLMAIFNCASRFVVRSLAARGAVGRGLSVLCRWRTQRTRRRLAGCLDPPPSFLPSFSTLKLSSTEFACGRSVGRSLARCRVIIAFEKLSPGRRRRVRLVWVGATDRPTDLRLFVSPHLGRILVHAVPGAGLMVGLDSGGRNGEQIV